MFFILFVRQIKREKQIGIILMNDVKNALFTIIFFILASTLIASSPIQVGEKLQYDIWYNFIKGGESTMEIVDEVSIEGKQRYHIESITRSTGLVDFIFSIDDKLESWVDPRNLYSYKFQKRIREGKYKKDYSVKFNYEDSLAISNKDTTEIKPPIHDALSIFYYLRKEELDTGKIFKVNNFDDDTLKNYNIKVTGKEIIKVPAGRFTCYKLAPYSEEGELFEKHENKVVTYISTDSLRLPVKITSDANFGKLIMKLKKVKN